MEFTLEAPKIVKRVIDKNGEAYCLVKRKGIIAKELAIRKATWEEMGKLMDWKLKEKKED